MGKRKTPAAKQKKASSTTARNFAKEGQSRSHRSERIIKTVCHTSRIRSNSDISFLSATPFTFDLQSQKSVNPTAKNPQSQLDGNTNSIQNNVHSFTPHAAQWHPINGFGRPVNAMQPHTSQVPPVTAAMIQMIPPRLSTPQVEQHAAHFSSGSIIPNISVLRQNQNINSVVGTSTGFI